MRISDWSSDVCSSDLPRIHERVVRLEKKGAHSEFPRSKTRHLVSNVQAAKEGDIILATASFAVWRSKDGNTDIFVGHYAYRLIEQGVAFRIAEKKCVRSEEHTSELQ